MYGKNSSIYGVRIPRKCIEYMHFYSCQSSSLKISFPQDERGGKNHDLLRENSIKKYEDDFVFCMIYNFSKCDGFSYSFVNIYQIVW